jgi:hypothetical protein
MSASTGFKTWRLLDVNGDVLKCGLKSRDSSSLNLNGERKESIMTAHQETLILANGPVLVIWAAITIGLVFFQTFIFGRLSLKYIKPFQISNNEVAASFKAGLITTIGPALSIFIVSLGLISQIGAPLTLARQSVIGNAAYETAAAQMAARVMGTSISADDYSKIAFTASVWVMNLGAICMILMPLFLTQPLSSLTQTVSKKTNMGLVIGLAASLASFGYFALDYIKRDLVSRQSWANTVAVISSFIVMLVLNITAKRFKIGWIKEWSLAISIMTAVILIILFF